MFTEAEKLSALLYQRFPIPYNKGKEVTCFNITPSKRIDTFLKSAIAVRCWTKLCAI